MLKIQGLECGYGRMKVLEGVNLEVGTESVGLFGPNGAGKTTLIGAIMGMNKPWAGTIELDGKSIGGTETHLMARMGVALVPQERELFPGMSVEDNLILGAAYIPHAKDKTAQQMEKMFTLFPILKERRKQLAGTMSGGQQRMVAIARALANRPRLLLADEPTGNLDPGTSGAVFQSLFALARAEGVGAVIATHNLELARHMDRVVTLRDGHLEPHVFQTA